MTIIFNKRTGTIKGVYSGDLQTIDILFGDGAEDYKLIWDEIILDDDDFVIRNPFNFRINPNTKQLEMVAKLDYPIAQAQEV